MFLYCSSSENIQTIHIEYSPLAVDEDRRQFYIEQFYKISINFFGLKDWEVSNPQDIEGIENAVIHIHRI